MRNSADVLESPHKHRHRALKSLSSWSQLQMKMLKCIQFPLKLYAAIDVQVSEVITVVLSYHYQCGVEHLWLRIDGISG